MKTTYGYVDVNDPHLFDKLHYRDIISRINKYGMLGQTHMIDRTTGKIRLMIDAGTQWDTPWVHINIDDSKNCIRLQMIEKCFDFVPTQCMDCWKIVIRPRTVVDLFKLYNLMLKMNEEEDVFCKCGCEINRPFVHALYGGYIYNNSRNEGEERLSQVRALLDKYLFGTKCYLKRYCSEFELRHGNTKGYSQPKEAKHWEELVDKYVEPEPKSEMQPDFVVDYVMAFWIKTAYYNGDPTVLQLNDGKHIYTQCQQYERGK